MVSLFSLIVSPVRDDPEADNDFDKAVSVSDSESVEDWSSAFSSDVLEELSEPSVEDELEKAEDLIEVVDVDADEAEDVKAEELDWVELVLLEYWIESVVFVVFKVPVVFVISSGRITISFS